MSAKDRLRLAKRKQVSDLALHDEMARTHSPTAIMRRLQLDHDPTSPTGEPVAGDQGSPATHVAPPPVEPLQERRRRPSGRKGRKF